MVVAHRVGSYRYSGTPERTLCVMNRRDAIAHRVGSYRYSGTP